MRLSWLACMVLIASASLCDEWIWTLNAAEVHQPRSMRQWALESITLPTGEFRDQRLDVERQPFIGLVLDALDDLRWSEVVITGPSQSGKTTIGFVIPLLYVVVELREAVVAGLPDGNMQQNKWNLDILPILEASPEMRELKPKDGAGSRGGAINDMATLTNGAPIKFMTRGGSDQSKAGFPGCRFLRVTEAAGFSHASETSSEADPFRQLKARLESYDIDKTQTVIEGTVTVATELPWTLRADSTRSRIVSPCPHCGDYIAPEREHFVGWEKADNVLDARDMGAFHCYLCGERIDDEQRRESLQGCVLIHDGQTIDKKGKISGDVPKTLRLWIRWSAWHNCLKTAATLSIKEWQAARYEKGTPERENAEKALRQFTWCIPYDPPRLDETPLDWTAIKQRSVRLPKGMLPADTQYFTIGMDLRKRYGHWIGVAWRPDQTCHVPDYGVFDISSDDLGVEIAMLKSLRDFGELIEAGWHCESGPPRMPDAVWIDAGYMGQIVYQFCRESGQRFLPTLGYGAGQHRRMSYSAPKRTGKIVREKGDNYHIEWSAADATFIVHVNADHWKSFTHTRFSTPQGGRGGMTLFDNQGNENLHTSLAKHLTAERKTQEFVPGKGLVEKWVTESRSNHWFDALYRACAAGHFVGWSLTEEPPDVGFTDDPSLKQAAGFRMPDGRPFLVTER